MAHNDRAHRYVHVIVNRVDLETGKAAGVDRSKLRLSKWAEGYEQKQGRIRCEERVTNNARRGRSCGLGERDRGARCSLRRVDHRPRGGAGGPDR